jgi:gluconate:H+ symporter, GntP family
MHPVLILLISVALLFLLIIRWKINAFAALITAAIFIGVLSPTVPISEVLNEVGQRFGNIVGRIGIAIAMAAIVGQCLMESGAADRITRRFVTMFGEKYASLSLVASGYVLAVPVFSDTVFYLLIPLARAMSVRMGGRNYVLYALAIAAGGSTTHVFVPPTPGPLVMAATLNIDLGIVILVGLAVAVPVALACWLYAIFIDRKLNISIREAPGMPLAELEKIALRPESELPGFWISMFPILLPVLLITANTVAGVVAKGSMLAQVTEFLGDPTLALLLAAAASLWVLARQKGLSLQEASKPAEEAIKAAGIIILITAGGGAFGGMLVKAGIGDMLAQFSKDWGISLMVLGFGLASMFKVAQGSATVGMITVSAIIAPLIVASPPPYHPVYILMAIGGGSQVGAWMNDSGFWVFQTMTGLNEIETLKTKSVMLAVLGTTGFLVSLLLSWLFPLV